MKKLLLLFLVFLYSCSPYNTMEKALPGEKKAVNLPDQSSVQLNAGSSLQFNSNTFADKRIVQLDGEAMFYVRRGSAFLVKTDYAIIRSFAHNFNVYARPDGFEVTCYIGKVEVIKDKEILELNMNEKATWTGDHFEKTVDPSDSPRWINNETVFIKKPYSSVIAELERQFNLKVDLDITGNPPFSGSFPHRSLQQAMDNIVDPFGYRYEQNGNQMRIWEP